MVRPRGRFPNFRLSAAFYCRRDKPVTHASFAACRLTVPVWSETSQRLQPGHAVVWTSRCFAVIWNSQAIGHYLQRNSQVLGGPARRARLSLVFCVDLIVVLAVLFRLPKKCALPRGRAPRCKGRRTWRILNATPGPLDSFLLCSS